MTNKIDKEAAALTAGDLLLVIWPGKLSSIDDVASVSMMLRRPREDVVAVFAAGDEVFVQGWRVKFLPDRDWIIFDRRRQTAESSEPAGAHLVWGRQVHEVGRQNSLAPSVSVSTVPAASTPPARPAPVRTFDPVRVGKEARSYIDQMQKDGFTVGATEAVRHILSNKE